jgi:hypothetical protein
VGHDANHSNCVKFWVEHGGFCLGYAAAEGVGS